jgi:hypothetical protein
MLGRWSYPVTPSQRFSGRGYGELDLEEREAALLPGEDPNTANPQDPAHWIRVYVELLATVDGALANHELTAGDRAVLEEYRSRYLHRLERWGAQLRV